jgi:HSP20 family protein
MNIIRHRRHGLRHATQQDALRQVFERALEAATPHHANDDSAVATAQWTPRVDIREDADRFVIQADLPGIDPRDIDVQMDKGILSIKGARNSEASGDDDRYARIERRYGRFHRRFALPDSADADAISAHGHNGVLEVVIPKKPETTPRRIQVGGAAPQPGEPTVQ